jgi:hypothetical protein
LQTSLNWRLYPPRATDEEDPIVTYPVTTPSILLVDVVLVVIELLFWLYTIAVARPMPNTTKTSTTDSATELLIE